MKEFEPEFRNPKDAFNQAIKDGRLVLQETSPNYAGKYMYMGTWDNKDQFKNSMYRNYLK